MKLWILTMFMLKAKMECLCEAIDKRLERTSLDMTTETHELVDKMFVYMDKKRAITNFAVLFKRANERLSLDEQNLVSLYTAGISMQQIAVIYCKSKATVCRRLNAALCKGERALLSLGFNKEKLEKEFFDIELVKRTYRMLSVKLKNASNSPRKKMDKRGKAISPPSGAENLHVYSVS